MENITLDFEQAKAKHLLFKSKLRAILYGAEVDEAPVLSHHECTVGKWIYNHALKAYGHIPEMMEMECVHADIHTKARDLIKLYKEGKVNAARIGLNDMEKIADRLVGLLSIVEQKIGGSSQSVAMPKYQPNEISIQELFELARANEELDRIIKQQSGTLLKERQLLFDMFMQLPAPIYIVKGAEHVFELINPLGQELIGKKEVLGRKVRDVFPELEGKGYFEIMDKVFQNNEPFFGKELPVQIIKGDGKKHDLFVNISYLPFKETNDEANGILCFAYDVTETVLSRKRIQENEERFRFLSDAMPVQSWTAGADGNVDYVNQRTVDYFNKAATDIAGEGWKEVVHPDDIHLINEKWTASLQTLQPYEAEFRLRNKNGQYRWHLTRANAFVNADGEVKWFGSNTDIHDMKLLQEQIQHSYEDLEVKVRFRNLELEEANMELQKKIEELSAKK